VLADDLGRYRLLRSTGVPETRVIAVEAPDPHGPYGAVGIGEPPAIPTAPAIANAVADATGLHPGELPLTPERLAKLLSRAGGGMGKSAKSCAENAETGTRNSET
jgi:CO/xanthine dehydrogenase Mo-binding subunit